MESQPLHTKSYGLPYDEMSNLPYFSPNKNIDGKMLSHFFSPNPKGLYTSKYGYWGNDLINFVWKMIFNINKTFVHWGGWVALLVVAYFISCNLLAL